MSILEDYDTAFGLEPLTPDGAVQLIVAAEDHMRGCAEHKIRTTLADSDRLALWLMAKLHAALELAQTCGAIATENAAEVQRLMGCIEELQAEVEILRCGDLHRYFDGRLPALRHAAFERHMATCLTCKDELHGLMQEAMATSGPDA